MHLPHPPRISVIIPTHNRAALLAETLDAVIAQSLPPYEIIVVDDGSTDGTAAMLAGRYADIVSTCPIQNSGDLVARNAGLRAASGDLVAFCDSDDLWRPGFLRAMANLWAAEPRTRVAYSDFVILRDGRTERVSKFESAPSGFWDGLRPVGPGLGVFDAPVVGRLVAFQPFFPSCMVADRLFLLNAGGWDASVGRVVGTDFATVLLLAEHVPFGVASLPLVEIRKHAGNHSADVGAMNLGDATILEHVLARRPTLADHAHAIRESVVRRRTDALDLAFARGDHAEVARIYALLPPARRGWPQRIKAGAAAMPGPLRNLVSATLLALGSARSRLVKGSVPTAA